MALTSHPNRLVVRGQRCAARGPVRHAPRFTDVQNGDGFLDGRPAGGESPQDSTWCGSRLQDHPGPGQPILCNFACL